jgi:multidrug efflux pump subunit AcrA (membrane-fusion protein)
VILEKPGTSRTPPNGTVHQTRSRPPFWRRRWVLVVILGALLAGGVALAITRSAPATPTATTAPAAAPPVAHGQVLPQRQARVGTQGGGVVQRLDVKPGDEVAAQTPLARIQGPSGVELTTAPFDGTITNVLVHAGDTVLPGAALAIVADMHALQVETTDVDEFLVGNVAVGQRVQVNVDALDNLPLSGTVANVALLPQSGTGGSPAYPVIISVSSLPPEVRAGMTVRVTFPERRQDDAVRRP